MHYETPESLRSLLLLIGAADLPHPLTDEVSLTARSYFDSPTRKFVKVLGISLTQTKIAAFDYSDLAPPEQVPPSIWPRALSPCRTLGEFRAALNSLLPA